MKKRYNELFLAAAVLLLLLLIPAFASAAVTLNDPRFGVANQSTFNITVSTVSATNCRYSSPFEKSFAEMTAFTSTGATAHKLENFQLPETGQAYKFFVECSDAEKGSFDLSVDASPPGIVKAAASPPQVIETPLQTKLIVETSENTSCKYDAEFYTYESMRNFFKINDVDKANYENNHEAIVSSGLADKTSYAYNVTCRNLAQLTSSLARIMFSIDTTIPPVISEVLPATGLATTSTEVNLSVTTNKRSVCSYGNTTEYKESNGNFTLTTWNHQATLKLESGQYKYYIRCLFEGPKEATADTSFIVDNTPPSAPAINDTQDLNGIEEGYTYLLDKLTFKLKSEDPESGIDLYNYSIVEESTGRVILNWTATRDSKVTVSSLKLRDGERYYIWAFAQNNAGLASAPAHSSGVTVNVLLNTEYACTDKLRDGDESDIDCGGSCRAKCANNRQCLVSSDCKTSYCVNNVCRSGNCTDGYQNQGETDVDCGGNCPAKCDLHSKCVKNSDCTTNLCSDGYCAAEGPCSNKQLDNGETDIDCGGLCVAVRGKKCALLQKCSQNSDCTTNFCGPVGKCTNQNDRDGDGILNDADLCPDVPNPNSDKKQTDSDHDKIGDECDTDNDNDGMPDEWEKKYGFNPSDPADAALDSDNDGLKNLDEYKLGTNPRSSDTDKDGADDGKEVRAHTDPKDPKSKPGSSFAGTATKMLIMLVLIVAAAAAYMAYKKGKGKSGKGSSGGGLQYAQPASHRAAPVAPHYAEPPVQQHQEHHRSHHEVFEKLEKTYSQLSGEELFEHLRRKTGRR